MERDFFGMSIEVWDTNGNRLLTDVLLLIEERLSLLFGVSSAGVRSFAEWIAYAKDARPEMGYLLDWMDKDANISSLQQYNLGNAPSDELCDEINVTELVLHRLDTSIDVGVLCSDFADAIEALGDVLKREVNQLIDIGHSKLSEICAKRMNWSQPKIRLQFEYDGRIKLGDDAASRKSEVAFSFAA